MTNWNDPEVNLHIKEYLLRYVYKDAQEMIVDQVRPHLFNGDEIVIDCILFKRAGKRVKSEHIMPMFIFNEKIAPIIRDNKINELLS